MAKSVAVDNGAGIGMGEAPTPRTGIPRHDGLTAEQNARADAALRKAIPELAAKFKDVSASELEGAPATKDVSTTSDAKATDGPAAGVDTEKAKATPAARSHAHEKAVKSLELFGMKPETAAKLSEQEALELAAHRNTVDAEYKAKVTRLNEYEAAAKKGDGTKSPKASAEAPQHPVSAGQGRSFVDAAKPFAEALALGDDALPILDGFAQSIAKAVKEDTAADLATTLGPLGDFIGDFVLDVERSAREGLRGKYPQSNDEAQETKLRARFEALSATGFYADAAPSYRGRVAKVWDDVYRLEYGEAASAPAQPAARKDEAKQNGQPVVSTQSPTPRGKTRMELIDEAALKAARSVGS
jgi:hypothetical protein